MENKKDRTLLTQDGYNKLQNELKNLIDIERPNVIQEIKDARGLGDLSENAEYDAARDKQGKIESRITEIESILQKAEIIKVEISDRVTIGSIVTLLNLDTQKTVDYKIGGPIDADPINNKISNESPLATSIMNHAVGDVIEVDAPRKYSVEIIKITH